MNTSSTTIKLVGMLNVESSLTAIEIAQTLYVKHLLKADKITLVPSNTEKTHNNVLIQVRCWFISDEALECIRLLNIREYNINMNSIDVDLTSEFMTNTMYKEREDLVIQSECTHKIPESVYEAIDNIPVSDYELKEILIKRGLTTQSEIKTHISLVKSLKEQGVNIRKLIYSTTELPKLERQTNEYLLNKNSLSNISLSNISLSNYTK